MLGAEVVNPMPANVQGATVCKKRVVHGTKGGVLVNAQTLKVRDSAYVLLRVENL